MDDLLTNLGSGAGGGIIGAIVSWLGLTKRLDKMETELSEFKRSIVFKDVCEKCQENTINQYNHVCTAIHKVETKIDTILENQSRIASELIIKNGGGK
jgi:hypothetical protein